MAFKRPGWWVLAEQAVMCLLKASRASCQLSAQYSSCLTASSCLVGWWTMLDAVVGDALLVRWQPCSQALATAWMTRPVA